MKQTAGIVLFFLFAGVFNVQAESIFEVDPEKSANYVGYTASRIVYSHDDAEKDFSPTAFIGKVGYKANSHFALEGRVGFGTEDDKKTLDDTHVALELDSLYGAYGVASYTFLSIVSVEGVIGYTGSRFTAKESLNEDSKKYDGLSYGAGLSVAATDQVSLTLEYMSYLTKSDLDISGFQFGVTTYF